MIRITDREIIDVVRYADNKVIFAERVYTPDLNSSKAKFFMLNFDNGEKEPATTTVYKLKKFGYAYEKICDKITDFIKCDAIILKDKSVLVMFEGGEAGLFDRDGEMLWNKTLSYNGSPMASLADDGDYFWCACKSEDSVIRYNAENVNIDIRVGGKGRGTFNAPFFTSSDEKYIYVCCADRVRKISKDNLTVSDVDGIYEAPKRFYKLGRFSILVKSDGTWIDKDE